MRKEFSFLLLFLMLSLNGCASIANPLNVQINSLNEIDLNGSWVFSGKFEDNKQSIESAIKQTNNVNYRGIKTTGVFDGRNTSKVKRNSRGVAHLFFENTNKIKITQTKYSLFNHFYIT